MSRLLVEKGADKGKSISVSATSTVIIGRDTSADLQLRDGMASRMHFKLESRADGTWLIDLDSLNGTLLNNQAVHESLLQPGDLIKVGETLFSYLAEDSASVDSLIGLRIGGYKVLERIGRGGMGTVYKAEQVDLQRIVALKVISKEHLKNREFVELFVHEARAAAKLNHPNIVQVYDVKKFNDLYYFSMEYVPGGNIQELLTKIKRIAPEKAVQMILESARGLEYAHKKQIIHRDIKPDNLMMSESDTIKIGDLGLAQRLGEKLSADDESSVIGTPHYIAPEQVLGKPADFRSDIYSLGSTMYRMIAGVTPYQAPGVRDLINKKVREDAPNLHQACPDVPGPVGEVCAKMMARQPEKRYSSMTEVIADLERIQRQSTPVATGDGARPSTSTRSEAVPANRRLLVAALGLMVGIVLIAGVGAVVVMTKPAASPSPSPTDSGAFSERDANLALDTANRLTLINLDRNNEEQLLKAIRQFSDVADRYPGTKAAAAAKREIEDFERSLRKIHAQVELASIGDLDRTQWTKMKQAYNGNTYDLSLIEPVIRAYESFASGAGKGTDAADEAVQRSRHIRDWSDRVLRAQEEFLSIKLDARSRMDQRRFQEAWELFGNFQTKTKGIAVAKSPFADHYTTLLYDDVSFIQQQKVAETARGEWNKVELDSIAAEQRHEYDKAAELLKPVIETFTEELRVEANQRHQKLVKLGAAWKEAEDRKLEAARSELADREKLSFQDLAKAVHDLNVKFDFKGGADRLAAVRNDAFKIDEFQERMKDRVEHQKRLVEFKARFLEMYGDSSSALKREIEYQPGQTGTILKVDAKQIEVAIGGGKRELAYSELTPSLFVTFLQGSWKRRPALYSTSIVAFCLETGLYEQALEELSLIAKGDYADWVAETKNDILKGETSDSHELEAERRYARIAEAAGKTDPAKQADLIKRGWADLDILRKVYGPTKFVESHRKELDEFAKRFTEKSDEKSKSDHKSGFKQKILGSRETARKIIEKPLGEVRGLLQNSKAVVNAAERSYHLGDLYAATANLTASNEQLNMARTLLLPKGEMTREEERQFHPGRLIDVYLAMMRNDILGNNAEAAARHAADCAQKQVDLMGGVREGWPEQLKQFETWRAAYDKTLNGKDSLRTLKASWEEHADEAEPLWALARAYETTYDMVSAFTCYSALIGEFPDEDRVRSGEAIVRQAECAFALRAVPLATELFFKAGDKTGRDLKRRVQDCYELQNQLSLTREKPPTKKKPPKEE